MTARRLLPCACVLALTWLTTACSGSGGSDVQVFGGSTDMISNSLTLHEGTLTIRAPGVPDAQVSNEGQLRINGQEVAVNEAQRDLLRHYNGAARQMHEDAIATGKAGAEIASKALGAVAGRMTGADSADEARQKAEAAAENVKLAAAKICDDLADMKTAQDALAAQLEAFKPYAQALTSDKVDKCRRDTQR